ncbi:GntR family transcriptional regulator [Peribacillus saganii]|uniref:GntR family transcriptional regulator n=1 Tax=Peribacillus saganii TaxID=2303992 RepID=A0A372LQM3_9BACI|nr:GntR family transcriptional regulator [Peribacillus saganii]RFU70501.1 GntR family transcriptional regulator [Peribacillus saganii]
MPRIPKHTPLHVQVYGVLRSKIIDGDYTPGESIVEAALSEELGVSRSPIREAIRLLEQDGLIMQEGSQKIIRKFTIKDIKEVYQCRTGLEILAANLATNNITSPLIDRLQELLQLSEKATYENDHKNVVKYNILFHNAIVHASDNLTLINIYQNLSGLFMYYRNSIFHNYHRDEKFLDEHKRIIQSIASGDPISAENSMKDHMEANMKDFFQFVLNKREQISSC